jgi:hypothetical protein
VADRDLKNIKKGLVDVKFETDNNIIANLPEDTVFVMRPKIKNCIYITP